VRFVCVVYDGGKCMRKTARFIIAVTLLITLGGMAAQGQDDAFPPPTIVFFEQPLNPQPLDVVENGNVEMMVSWHVIHVNESHHLALEAYQGREWISLLEPGETLPMVGSRGVMLTHPANFGPPTYRLSIRDAGNRILDEWTLVVPYQQQQAVAPPAIQAFTSDLHTVDPTALADGNARIPVTWTVTGRQLTTNLQFQQVLADGSVVSVELPRSSYWVPSSGTGAVAPIPPGGRDAPVVAGDMVQLRLQVVDVISGDIYDTREILLDVLEPGAAQPEPANPTVVSFTATPETITSGGTVTLSWETLGAQRAWIEQYSVSSAGTGVPAGASPDTLYSDQPLNGSLAVTLPADYQEGGTAVFVLVLDTYEANVKGPSAQIEVPIFCAYTFFFEGGVGCPVGPPQNVEAVYQPFENGHVVMRRDSGGIYVHIGQNQGEQSFYPTDEITFTENPVTDEPPAGRYKPQGTIGLVWGNFEEVRAKLGWAIGPEQSYTMQVQPVSLPPQVYTIYFTLPDGNVVGTGKGWWAIIQ
jgi:hypothetical protein